MIEIGSYQGQSMEAFAKSKKVKTIFCIDPWKEGYDSKDIASSTNMKEVEKKFDERVTSIDKEIKIIKHKGTLDTFIDSLEYKNFLENGNNIDFVYIDGCHTYESCKHDIEVCKNVIKPKLAFTGHDYVDGWIGVKTAVNESFGVPDKTFPDSSWVKMVY